MKDKLVPLKTLAYVRRGVTTGINEFFYLTQIRSETLNFSNARNWQGYIEPEYLRKVIKSPKDSESIRIDSKKLKNYLFVCNKSKEELKNLEHFHALNYIEWGEKQRTSENILWTEVSSVKSRKYWYGLNMEKPGSILMQMVNNDRFLIFLNEDYVCVDHNLFEYLITDEEIKKFAIAFLNSSLFALIKEVNSRVNLGDGATKTEGIDWNNLMLIPKESLPIKFNETSFFERKIQNVYKEGKLKDRKKLDVEILKLLNLDDLHYLPLIKNGLEEMVTERLFLPKQRKKQNVRKVQISYEDVKRSVISECIGSQPKKFPESFYTPSEIGQFYENLKFETINTSGTPLQEEYFLGNYTLTDIDKQLIYETDSIDKVKFIKKLALPGMFQIKVPKDLAVFSSIIENYQNYISSLKEILLTNANQKLHSWNEAQKMASEILKEYNFEEIE